MMYAAADSNLLSYCKKLSFPETIIILQILILILNQSWFPNDAGNPLKLK